MAECVARAMAERQGLAGRIEFDSAGTSGYHAGEPPDERACQVALRRGYRLSGLRARKISPDDFVRFDLVFAMDKQNLAFLERCCPEGMRSKLRLFLDCAGGGGVKEVPDPYYGNLEGFERVLDLCEAAAAGLLDEIKRVTGN